MIRLLFSIVFVIPVTQLPTPSKKPVAAAKNVADFKAELKILEDWSAHLDDEAFYDKVFTLTNRKTGEVKQFSKLEAFQKRMFFSMSAEEISKRLDNSVKTWRELLDDLPNDDGKEATDAQPPKKANLKKLITHAVAVQKLHAPRWEAVAEGLFNDYADRFTDKEKEHYLQKMREYHDKNKFIKR